MLAQHWCQHCGCGAVAMVVAVVARVVAVGGEPVVVVAGVVAEGLGSLMS